jgi:hypothetical protein
MLERCHYYWVVDEEHGIVINIEILYSYLSCLIDLGRNLEKLNVSNKIIKRSKYYLIVISKYSAGRLWGSALWTKDNVMLLTFTAIYDWNATSPAMLVLETERYESFSSSYSSSCPF